MPLTIGLVRAGAAPCTALGDPLRNLDAAAAQLGHAVRIVSAGTPELDALRADPASVLIEFHAPSNNGTQHARSVRWHAPDALEPGAVDGYALHLAPTPAAVERLAATGVARERIAHLPPFVDLAVVSADIDLLARWQAPAGCWLAVGALQAAPLQPLLDAFAAYLGRCERDARLILLDAGEDVEERAALAERARALRLDPQVEVARLNGAALKAALLSADALLMTTAVSDPLAAIAALQLGVPVVGGKEAAAAWAVAPGALLWEREEPTLLAATLERVRGDGRLRAELRRRGFAHADRNFSPLALQRALAAALERFA